MRLALVFSLLLCACAASEEPYDDVASQESAVEAPPVSENMQIIRDACEMKCGIGGTLCHNNCRPSDGSWCDNNCEGDEDICRGQCSTDFPGATASFVDDAEPPPSEEDMHIRVLYVACYNSCSNYYGNCMVNFCELVMRGLKPGCESDCAYNQWQCQAGCAELYNTAN